MRKLLVVIIMLIISVPVWAQENTNNPGYFESPGFIGLGGSAVRNKSSMERDDLIAPYLFGVYNLHQSEYGNLGLLASVNYSRPEERHSSGLKMKSNMFSGDLGIGYFTGAKTINFFLGVGYSFAYVDGEFSAAAYSEDFTSTSHGFFYFLGLEYMLRKDGKWGLMFIMSGREYGMNDVDYSGGGVLPAGTSGLNVSNQVYSFGVIYHF